MPEPAAVQETQTEELRFATEEEQAAALAKFTEDGREPTPEDISEIDRITNAPVGDGSAPQEPVEPTGEEPASQEPTHQPAEETQQEASQETPQESVRSFNINEELISQFDEEYTDRNGRRRRTITQKNPEDFLKSYVSAQRRIRYLESEAMSDAENVGYQRAKSEAQKQIEELQSQLNNLKSATPQQQAPAPQPEQGQQPTPQQSESSDARKRLQDNLAKISDVKEGDEFDHMPTVMSALRDAVSVIGELDKTVNKIQTEGTEAFRKSRETDQEARQRSEQEQATARQQEENQRKWQNACRLVDGFVASKDCPDEYRLDIPFDEATRNVMSFHTELAKHYTGKPQSQLTNQDRTEAVAAYLAGNPQLRQRAEQAGLREPDWYKGWVVLDQVDALRNGYYRDPNTKMWRDRFSPDSGRRVQFPDMASAFEEFRRITGQSKADVSRAVKQNTDQLVNAINQRDKGLVQMDETKTAGNQQPGTLPEAEATARIDQLNEIGGIDEAIRRAAQGDPEMVNQYNEAMSALGQPPIPPHLYERYLPKTADNR
jgi:hypothetical protein